MKTVDRIIGIWMVIAGVAMFVFAHFLEPYMHTLSGVTLYVVAIPTAIFLASATAALGVLGMAQAVGAITIWVEGGE